VVGQLACVAEGAVGMHTVDVADITDMRRLGTVGTRDAALDVEIVDDIAFVAEGAAGVKAVELDLPGGPADDAWFDLPGETNSVTYHGGRLYVTTKEGGLWIVSTQHFSPAVWLPLAMK